MTLEETLERIYKKNAQRWHRIIMRYMYLKAREIDRKIMKDYVVGECLTKVDKVQ